ncbi:MAG: HAD-IIIA family hydrolase, partial [Candidatus Zixiibacteriota bacterium]
MTASATVVIAPGASFANKQWPIERMAEVALALNKTAGAKIIWAITSEDASRINIEEKIGQGNVIQFVDCPIDQLADIIYSSDLCLANDSGIAHLSSAVGTPVISIFGPTHPALGFAPRGLFDRVIEVDEFCRPCSLHGDKPCFREERFCFTKISPPMVVAVAIDIMRSRQKRSRALFIDRDGTVIIDKPFDSNPDNIEFESGSIEALLKAQRLGFKIVVVSNQSGVARGYFNFEDAERFNKVLVQLLLKNGVTVDAIYFCPHYPEGIVADYARVCGCRKPAPGMAEKGARELNLDLRRSYVVGDKMDDFNLGRIVGAHSFLVKTGQGQDYLELLRGSCANSDNYICENLKDAVDRIEIMEKT